LYEAYNEIVANIDSLNHIQLFHKVNAVLNIIREMKANPAGYRNSIHDSVAIKKESDRNYREQLKSGFETNLSNISFGLEKVAKALQKYVASSQLHGGAVEPQRKDLSKEKLRMFMMTPAAQHYKLDNIDVMQQVLSFPETRQKLTTLINAIDRGQVPADGPEVMAEASAIRQWLNNKEKTNLPALEVEQSGSNTILPAFTEKMVAPSSFSPQDLEEEKNMRDFHHSMRQVREMAEQRKKKEEEEALTSKYSHLDIEQWFRS